MESTMTVDEFNELLKRSLSVTIAPDTCDRIRAGEIALIVYEDSVDEGELPDEVETFRVVFAALLENDSLFDCDQSLMALHRKKYGPLMSAWDTYRDHTLAKPSNSLIEHVQENVFRINMRTETLWESWCEFVDWLESEGIKSDFPSLAPGLNYIRFPSQADLTRVEKYLRENDIPYMMNPTIAGVPSSDAQTISVISTEIIEIYEWLATNEINYDDFGEKRYVGKSRDDEDIFEYDRFIRIEDNDKAALFKFFWGDRE
jgi:hypothetical protein